MKGLIKMILESKEITKIYGGKDNANSTVALNGVNIKIDKGEFVGIMGPSGSGKSTLVNILSGIDTATTGNVIIGDKDITSFTSDELSLFRRRKLGFVFQDFNLIDSLTLKENVMLPMILDKKSQKEMDEKADFIMKKFGILEMADKYPYNVSGGQQQRTAVSRSLVNNPEILFADEPTGNLDSKSSNAVMNLFTQINEELSTTVLMVTHDTFAASFCKRIIFIKDGNVNMEIIRKGSRKEFFDRILDCLAVSGGENNDI